MEEFYEKDNIIYPAIGGRHFIVNKTNDIIDKLHITPQQLNGAMLAHGSSSSSLMAYTDYMNNEGELIPLGKMESKGKIPFSGEISFGRSGINVEYLSTVNTPNLDVALKYACMLPTKSITLEEYTQNAQKFVDEC